MELLPAAGRIAVPWKNGGGMTIGIAAEPEGAGPDAFDWRVSLASVAGDGPFSLFPDVDRTLTVLTGRGIDLLVERQGPLRLDPSSPPYGFPGDVATSARLVDGPIEDLNVMTRRGRYIHQVKRLELTADARREIIVPPGLLFVTARCRIGALHLEPRDAVRVRETEAVAVEGAGPGALFLITIAPVGPTGRVSASP